MPFLRRKWANIIHGHYIDRTGCRHVRRVLRGADSECGRHYAERGRALSVLYSSAFLTNATHSSQAIRLAFCSGHLHYRQPSQRLAFLAVPVAGTGVLADDQGASEIASSVFRLAIAFATVRIAVVWRLN
jgi:hypothetical protein